MLRLLVNIIFLLLIIGLLRPIFRRGIRYSQKIFDSARGGGRIPKRSKRKDANLSPYEIEDADYEDIHPDGR